MFRTTFFHFCRHDKRVLLFLSVVFFCLMFASAVQANPTTTENSVTASEEQSKIEQSSENGTENAGNAPFFNENQLTEYDIYARSNIRSSIAAMGGAIQERVEIIADNIGELIGNITKNIKEHYIETLVTKAPKKDYSIEPNDEFLVLKSTIQSGDSLGSLINGWFPFSKILEIVESSKDTYSLSSLQVGKPIVFYLDKKEYNLKRFEYELDMAHKVIIDFKDDSFMVAFEEIPYEYTLEYIEGTVKGNFFNSVTALNEGAIFAIRLADVFTYDIDFAREIKEGDTFRALVEKRYRDGEFNGYGRIIGASFTNNGKTYEAFLYHDSEKDDKLSYFNRKGEALQKAFLRTPVHFTRISSRYTMARKHPILGYTRPHQGIDYAAPKGTPVMAVGDGTVTRAAYTGGYGHLIILRHRGGLESQYGHLAGYAKGIKSGASVSQGQVIGYVGSTGLSTGPHLDFRIKKNGQFVNPDKIIIPSKPPLRKEQLDGFFDTVKILDAYMNKERSVQDFQEKDWLNGIR